MKPPKRPHNVPKRFYSSQARPRNLEKVNRGHLLRCHQFEEHFLLPQTRTCKSHRTRQELWTMYKLKLQIGQGLIDGLLTL